MGVQSVFREERAMKILLFSCLLLATLGLASGGILKKLKKLLKTEDECEVVWEEHYQPHCTTRYEKHCESVKVKVARRHCREGKGKKDKIKEKLFGKKLKKAEKKQKGGGGYDGGYDTGYGGGIIGDGVDIVGGGIGIF